MRGRVMAILLAIALGGTPIGAPIVGWVADTLRPALGARRRRRGRSSAATVALVYLARRRHPGAGAAAA